MEQVRMFYFTVLASLLLVGLCQQQKNVCDPMDDGPFLGTLPTLVFTVKEATEADLQAESAVSLKYSSELRLLGDWSAGDFNVTVVSTSQDPWDYFRLFSQDGKNYLKLVRAIDRDGPTSDIDGLNLIPFVLTCTPSNASLPDKVYDARIFIEDINDNVPVFPAGNASLIFNFSESTAVGTVLFTASADDRDLNLEQKVTYYLKNHNDQFAIDNQTGAVILTSALDYDDVSRPRIIDLILTAQDGGPGSINTVTTTATLWVTDADDQDPAFSYPGCFSYKQACAWPKYTASRTLVKNQPIVVLPVPNKGQGQVSIKAVDPDLDVADQISFSIAATIPNGLESQFRVTTSPAADRGYEATIVPLNDSIVNEGFEIFLAATEESTAKRHTVAMILFTGSAIPDTTAAAGTTAKNPATGAESSNQQGGGDDADYSKMEVALIVVVAILATLLLCVCLVLLFCWRRSRSSGNKKSMAGSSNNGFTERL